MACVDEPLVGRLKGLWPLTQKSPVMHIGAARPDQLLLRKDDRRCEEKQNLSQMGNA